MRTNFIDPDILKELQRGNPNLIEKWIRDSVKKEPKSLSQIYRQFENEISNMKGASAPYRTHVKNTIWSTYMQLFESNTFVFNKKDGKTHYNSQNDGR